MSYTLRDKTGSVDVRFFDKNEEKIPPSPALGDIVLLTAVKIKQVHGKMLILSSFYTKYVYMPSKGVVICSRDFKPHPTDMSYMHKTRAWWKSENVATSATSGSSVSPARIRTDRFALLKDMVVPELKPGMMVNSNTRYYDMLGRVVKFFPGGKFLTVYITDYTENNQLFDYDWYTFHKDNKQWLGPWGKRTLQVTFWGQNMAAGNIISEGDILFLRNMRIKWADFDTNPETGQVTSGYYEGALHDDPLHNTKVSFMIVDLGEAHTTATKNLLQREKEYRRQEEGLRGGREAKLRKMLTLDDGALVSSQSQSSPPPPIKRVVEPLGENPRIKCTRHAEQPTPIGTILKLAHDNRKYQIVSKVIDFIPQTIENFAKLVEVELSDEEPEYNQTNEKDVAMNTPEKDVAMKWVWRFAILVEGRDGNTLRVIVEGKNAEYLLNLEAAE